MIAVIVMIASARPFKWPRFDISTFKSLLLGALKLTFKCCTLNVYRVIELWPLVCLLRNRPLARAVAFNATFCVITVADFELRALIRAWSYAEQGDLARAGGLRFKNNLFLTLITTRL